MKLNVIRGLVVLTFLLVLLTAQVHAKNNGVGDQDMDESSAKESIGGLCGNQCHTTVSSGASISINASQCCNFTIGQTGINITANTSGITENDNILGIMLFNSSLPTSSNIKNDGWVITQDPNNNPTKYNYNEKTGLSSLNQMFNWTITAPNTPGTFYIKAEARYGGTSDYNVTSTPLTMNVQPKTIDVTLSNVPVNFGDVSAGYSNQPALLPLNVTIQSTTNVNVNLTLNGSDFTYLAYSFGVGNLSYSNSSAGTKINMVTSFPPPPFASWVNLPKRVITNRSVYFWINIPAGQDAGAYSSNISVRAEEYI